MISLLVFQVVEGEEYKPFGFYSRSVLRINVTETVNYTCYAINQMMGGRQSSDQKSFMVYVESNEGLENKTTHIERERERERERETERHTHTHTAKRERQRTESGIDMGSEKETHRKREREGERERERARERDTHTDR